MTNKDKKRCKSKQIREDKWVKKIIKEAMLTGKIQ